MKFGCKMPVNPKISVSFPYSSGARQPWKLIKFFFVYNVSSYFSITICNRAFSVADRCDRKLWQQGGAAKSCWLDKVAPWRKFFIAGGLKEEEACNCRPLLPSPRRRCQPIEEADDYNAARRPGSNILAIAQSFPMLNIDGSGNRGGNRPAKARCSCRR
jgi:hypothetical protein